MSYSSNTKGGSGSQRSNDDWIVELIWAMFKAAGYLLWLAILFPAVSVPAFISLVMMLRYGIGVGMLTGVGLGAGYGLWAALDARSFERCIAQPVRQRFQMWWRYTRTWEQVCALNGLTARHQDRTLTPLVRSIWIGKHADVIDSAPARNEYGRLRSAPVARRGPGVSCRRAVRVRVRSVLHVGRPRSC